MKSRLIWASAIAALVVSGVPAISPCAAEVASQSAAPSPDIDALLDRADALRASGDIDGAMRLLANVLKIAPQEPRAMGAYGKLLVARGQPREAIVYLNWAIRLAPDDWDLLTARGVAHDQIGDTEGARSDLNRALAMKPDDPAILYDLALSHTRTGDFDEAKALLRQAQAKAGASPRISAQLAAIEKMQQAPGAPAAEEAGADAIRPKTIDLQAQKSAGASQSENRGATATAAVAAQTSLPARARKAAPMPAILRRSSTGEAELYVQAGAFAVAENAQRLKEKLARFGALVLAPAGKRTLYFVRTGPYSGLAQARAARSQMEALGMQGLQIVGK